MGFIINTILRHQTQKQQDTYHRKQSNTTPRIYMHKICSNIISRAPNQSYINHNFKFITPTKHTINTNIYL